MPFTVERLTALSFPQLTLPDATVAATLDAAHAELAQQYRTRHAEIVKKLDALTRMLNDPAHWWHAPGPARIASEENWQRWHQRQLAALTRFDADRRAWRQALAVPTARG